VDEGSPREDGAHLTDLTLVGLGRPRFSLGPLPPEGSTQPTALTNLT